METLDKEQQIERLYATAPVYEWELIVNPISFRTQMTYFFLLFSILLSVIFFLTDSGAFSIVPILGAAFLCPWFRYLVNADKRYYYAINQYGIYLTEEDIIPEIAYTIVRRSAWVGCAICIFAAIFIGPMAFVGAGGAALMSFGMTNFRPKPYKHQCLFDGYAQLEYYESCKSFINTKESFFLSLIPKQKLKEIESVLAKFNDTFETEYIDDLKDAPRFQAHRVILEVVR
ncbi:hypothetical protein [Photobacterium angustum]|uniref:hypothetical protein n=1 Tax=Photobacterium angustum TaxID=661 RepID=UPI000D166A1C|nr:hypothetical protein [Photobacterium angustum]PSV95411.1 hypothetical protein CTN01_04240 [Photobacterium angustum]PSW78870.1 hypothetical protein CTN03_16920 [Photobacterium angustum]